jgi:hypothetical protein
VKRVNVYVQVMINFILCCVLSGLAYLGAKKFLLDSFIKQCNEYFTLASEVIYPDSHLFAYVVILSSILILIVVTFLLSSEYFIVRQVSRFEKVAERARKEIFEIEKEVLTYFYYSNADIIEVITTAQLLVDSLTSKVSEMNNAIRSRDMDLAKKMLGEQIYIKRSSSNSIVFSSVYKSLPEMVHLVDYEHLFQELCRRINRELLMIKHKCRSNMIECSGRKWVSISDTFS